VLIIVVVYFVIDPVRRLLDTPSYNEDLTTAHLFNEHRHPASYPGDEAAGAWSWPLTSI